jgi:Holliday junction resolvase-like predicted endonuclease
VQAEIDLVAYDGDTLRFVEAKTRRSDDYAAPEAEAEKELTTEGTEGRIVF